MIFRISILLIFCFNLSAVIPDNYPYRDITKPIFPLPAGVRIFQISPPRTGSTLIFNILQYLFEDTLAMHYTNRNKRVYKGHGSSSIRDDNIYFVSTIRNPLDALASWVCANEKLDDNRRAIVNERKLMGHARFILSHYNSFYRLSKSLPSDKILILKYEIFDKNFEYVYSELENFFHISIDSQTRESINKYFNKDAMKSLASEYQSYNNYHPYIGIHGKHINYVNWKVNIPPEFHDLILNQFKDVLLLFDYPTEYP